MTYYDAMEVVRRGKMINYSPRDKKPSVREGEVLVGIMDNSIWAVAPDVTLESEFEHFYEAYAQGSWVRMTVYALPESELPNCQDKGRVPTKDLDRLLEEHPPRIEYRY